MPRTTSLPAAASTPTAVPQRSRGSMPRPRAGAGSWRSLSLAVLAMPSSSPRRRPQLLTKLPTAPPGLTQPKASSLSPCWRRRPPSLPPSLLPRRSSTSSGSPRRSPTACSSSTASGCACSVSSAEPLPHSLHRPPAPAASPHLERGRGFLLFLASCLSWGIRQGGRSSDKGQLRGEASRGISVRRLRDVPQPAEGCQWER